MALRQKYINNNEYLTVDIQCVDSDGTVKNQPLFECCGQGEWPHIIIDASTTTRELFLSEQYHLVTQIYFLKEAPLRSLAIVLPADLAEKFGENITRIAYFPIRVFENYADAAEWIEGRIMEMQSC